MGREKISLRRLRSIPRHVVLFQCERYPTGAPLFAKSAPLGLIQAHMLAARTGDRPWARPQKKCFPEGGKRKLVDRESPAHGDPVARRPSSRPLDPVIIKKDALDEGATEGVEMSPTLVRGEQVGHPTARASQVAHQPRLQPPPAPVVPIGTSADEACSTMTLRTLEARQKAPRSPWAPWCCRVRLGLAQE